MGVGGQEAERRTFPGIGERPEVGKSQINSVKSGVPWWWCPRKGQVLNVGQGFDTASMQGIHLTKALLSIV